MKKKFLFAIYFLLASCSGSGSSYQGSVGGPLSLKFETLSVPNVENVNGIWWGENKSKIVRSSDKIFTMTIDDDPTGRPFTIQLLERDIDTKALTLGITLSASTAPDILIDSSNVVHVIAFEPFATNPYDGKYVHYKMSAANTVVGAFTKADAGTFLPASGTSTTSDFGTIYGSAAMDSSDNIYIVYNNSTSNFNDVGECLTGSTDAVGPHSIGLRVYDGASWSYEDVATTLPTRNAYPKVVVSDNYIHIAAVEDEFKSSLRNNPAISPATGDTYCSYAFLYGEINYFSRTKISATWTHHKVLDFNSTRTVAESYDMFLRLKDIEVTNGTVYMLYDSSDEPRSAAVFPGLSSMYLIKIDEGAGAWVTEHINGSDTAPYKDIVNKAKLFVEADGDPYVYFEGYELDTAIASSGSNDGAFWAVKNINTGVVHKNYKGPGSNHDYEPFVFSPSNGSDILDGETHFILYPRTDSVINQKPQLLKIIYDN